MDGLRKALPNIECGVDLIPVESKVLESVRRLTRAPMKYQALYNLLLDSGLRLVEGGEVINRFQDAEVVEGFAVARSGCFEAGNKRIMATSRSTLTV